MVKQNGQAMPCLHVLTPESRFVSLLEMVACGHVGRVGISSGVDSSRIGLISYIGQIGNRFIDSGMWLQKGVLSGYAPVESAGRRKPMQEV